VTGPAAPPAPPAPVGSAGPAGRRLGGLLWERDFRLLWTGETVSLAGSAMATVGLPLLAVARLHAGPFAVSALTAAAYLPWLIIGLPAGAWVDRLAPRPLMIGCDLIAALLFASVPVAGWLGVLTIGQVLAVALLAGAANVLFSTAYQVGLPEIIPAADLIEGNAKLQGSASVAAIVGRGAAGLAARALGDAPALLFNAGSFLVSAGCLRGIRGTPRPTEARPTETGSAKVRPAEVRPTEVRPTEIRPTEIRRSVRADIADSIRYIAADPYLRPLTVYTAMANLTYSGTTALLVLFLVRVADLGAAVTGLLLAAGGVGGVAGALTARRLAARIGTARVLLVTNLGTPAFGLLIPLTAAGPRVACFVVGSTVVSAGIATGNVILASFRQAYCPASMLGRISATQRFLSFGSIPLGSLLAGGLATAVGVRAALWVAMALFAASGTLLLRRVFLARRDLPAEVPTSAATVSAATVSAAGGAGAGGRRRRRR
jgi:Major Facilitator Superfamily